MSGNGEMQMVDSVEHDRGTLPEKPVPKFPSDDVDSMLSARSTSYDSGFLPCCKDGSCEAGSSGCSLLDVPETTAVLQDTGQPTPAPQSGFEAEEKLDRHGELNLEVPEKPPVLESSSDDVDSKLSASKGCEGLMSDETFSGLLTSCEADSVISDADHYTGDDTSCMDLSSPSPPVATTSVHSSDTVQSPVYPGTPLQQSTNGTIHLAVIASPT